MLLIISVFDRTEGILNAVKRRDCVVKSLKVTCKMQFYGVAVIKTSPTYKYKCHDSEADDLFNSIPRDNN